jgi:steroid 5-alpha reductase family enzyme
MLQNASVYDPYWSVAPIVILTLLVIDLGTFNPGAVILLLIIWYWGVRLTVNWALTFSSLGQQDWRYDLLRSQTNRLYPLVSLTGIHLFPTLVVFLAIIPAIHYIQVGRITPVTIIGYAICLAAATLQWIADYQMHRHKKSRPERFRIIDSGLWQYCRHPNYLGEIMMWWGVYVVMASVLPQRWYLLAGALANTLMFLFISIPMAEKRLACSKQNYREYASRTPMLLPIKKRLP